MKSYTQKIFKKQTLEKSLSTSQGILKKQVISFFGTSITHFNEFYYAGIKKEVNNEKIITFEIISLKDFEILNSDYNLCGNSNDSRDIPIFEVKIK